MSEGPEGFKWKSKYEAPPPAANYNVDLEKQARAQEELDDLGEIAFREKIKALIEEGFSKVLLLHSADMVLDQIPPDSLLDMNSTELHLQANLQNLLEELQKERPNQDSVGKTLSVIRAILTQFQKSNSNVLQFQPKSVDSPEE